MNITDYLVIGSGLAGLSYALKVADYGKVTVICKRDPAEGNTRYAQGGIAAVASIGDSFEAHSQDTLTAGAGLCRVDVVRHVIKEGPGGISKLLEYGTTFDRLDNRNAFSLTKEGGHSARRIYHFKDQTGAEIQRAILHKALSHPNIEILSDHIAIELIKCSVSDSKDFQKFPQQVLGCYVLDAENQTVKTLIARATMLATGGAGKVYLYTSNPDVATGDGIAMAYRAGAEIRNMEFFQFHPTCLYHPQAKAFLLSEALRGEGAMLKSITGERFMKHYSPQMELAPRDIVARAIDSEMKRSGADHVLLDISHLDSKFIESHFPTLVSKCHEFGFDLTRQAVPVVPAAHYCCGGVASTISGSTTLKRLYVAGESACTGLHGANRLASNSLLEAIVFANAAADSVLDNKYELPDCSAVPEWNYFNSVSSEENVFVTHNWEEIRRSMWNLVGIVRSTDRLLQARKRIDIQKEEIKSYYWRYLPTRDLIELRNLVTIAELIVESALLRKESRGLHYMLDYPESDDIHFSCDTVLQNSDSD